jgi:acetylornithine deacetylase/succinyl-diaminopimelate desuccinylase-like protein
MIQPERSLRIRLALLAWVGLGLVGVPGEVRGQNDDVAAVVARPAVRQAESVLEAARGRYTAFLARIGAIVSPSGEERARAEAVAERMREIGLDSVRVTDSPNAIGVIPGRSGRAIVFLSTLDDLATVAEHQRAAGTPMLAVTRDRVVGPGANTSLTTAALLAAAEAYVSADLRPEHDLVFAAVAEEETGLRGMKALYSDYGPRAEAFVDVLGDGQSISYGALGIHWWRVVAEGPPGHTLEGGVPNVNQALGRAVDRILSLPAASSTDETRTRLNVSILESGTVFNHKPASGWFSVDIRSMEADIIEGVEQDVRDIVATVARETGIDLRMEPFQLTPGGRIPGAVDSPLVRSAQAISRHLGYEPSMSESGSSNLNVAIAAGTPAIGLGGSRGGDRGMPTEWADVEVMMRTAHHVLLLAVTLGGAGTR